MSMEEENLTLRKHSYREDMTEKKKLGIIETVKTAKTENELMNLATKLEGYKYASTKTIRKFLKIVKRKRVQLKKKK